MALDEADRRLFIGCRSPAKLLVLDTETGKTVATVDIVGDTARNKDAVRSGTSPRHAEGGTSRLHHGRHQGVTAQRNGSIVGADDGRHAAQF
jgi:hypothetical protein